MSFPRWAQQKWAYNVSLEALDLVPCRVLLLFSVGEQMLFYWKSKTALN